MHDHAPESRNTSQLVRTTPTEKRRCRRVNIGTYLSGKNTVISIIYEYNMVEIT